jgi:hypothetical protein
MQVGMSLFQNEHSVWCVRKKVPKALEQAVATVLGNGKKRQPWLQRSALQLPVPQPRKAEAHFERALAVARQQQGKSWELRASMSLVARTGQGAAISRTVRSSLLVVH